MMKNLLALIIFLTLLIACSSNTDIKEKMPSNQIEDTINLPGLKEELSVITEESTEKNIKELALLESNKKSIVSASQIVDYDELSSSKEVIKTNISSLIIEDKEEKSAELIIKEDKIVLKEAIQQAVALNHVVFNDLLNKYVSSSGAVDYEGFKANKAKLSQYLEILKNNPPQKSWSQNKEMAYWINLYNAVTIHAIIEKYPINSIMDLDGGKIWDKKIIQINGENLTLNIIEKEKLLQKFKEPRVHFAVNCAAASCPPLLNKTWEENNIQSYLEQQTKLFVNNKKHNTLSAKSIELSSIFSWYAADFGGVDELVNYIQKYSEIAINKNAKVRFKEYDWRLNKN